MKDYYKILELEFGADILAVKKTYRRLALKYHPDKNKERNTVQKFIEITEAYEVLRDPLKKSEYDSLYKTYFRTKTHEQYSEQTSKQTYQRKQQEWANYGREKAKEYSSIPFEEFAKQLLREISIGASYIPNAIAILFACGGSIVMLRILPKAFKDGDGIGLIILIMFAGLLYLTYRLFLVALADYKKERKHKIFNNK